METIKVYAPATVANVACGFDILGFAVNSPGDEIILKRTKNKGIKITKITGDKGFLSKDPLNNCATLPIIKYLEHIKNDIGLEVELHKGIPFAGGMGSSSASSVVGVFAVNALLGYPLSTLELLPFALEGERLACGIPHADNAAPALLGGFTVIRSYDPLDVVKIDCPKELCCVLVNPEIQVKTEDARKILRQKIKLKDAITQWGNIAGLIAGLMKGDFELIKRSLKDELIEPVRSLLIPGFYDVKFAALENGALGCSISGSGPTIFALTNDIKIAEKVGKAMVKAFKDNGIGSKSYISNINLNGPEIIS